MRNELLYWSRFDSHFLIHCLYSKATPMGDVCSITNILNDGRCDEIINATEITTVSTATPAAIA